MLVGGDALALVELNADLLEPESFDERTAPDGDEHQVGLDRLAVAEVDGQLRAVVLDLRALLAELEGDAALAELLRELLRRIGIFLWDQRVEHLDDRDLRAEAVEDRCELAADDPAAEHDEALRHGRLCEQARRVDAPRRVDPLDGRPQRKRARRDDRRLERDVLPALDRDRVRVLEAARALDPLDAVRLEEARNAGRHLLDDAGLPHVGRIEVERCLPDLDAELRVALPGLAQRVRSLHPRLGGDAADAQARSSELRLLLDARDLRAELCGADCGGVAPGAAPENSDVNVHFSSIHRDSLSDDPSRRGAAIGGSRARTDRSGRAKLRGEMHVEFRVLGPIEVRRAGAPVPLRASKQRTFLADLLVHGREVVSVDRLIEDLWPVSPPAGARHALEAHASRLRNLLGDDVPLVARPPGYILDVDPQSVDSVRFEQLLAEARDSQAADPARASARASDALALWRGDAYADFAFESFAQEEIARLEELRLEAEEERIEAELALGRSAEIVGELEALVVAAPLRERRRGQLMLALYRAGRQSDALEAFREARELLVEELGLEPSEELRELERRILRQDPELASAAAPRTESRVSRRLVTVVAVEPEISLDLDVEEHDRETQRAAGAVAAIAEEYGAVQPEPFLLVFAHEDHVERATTAAAAVREATGARVGLASGEALLGGGSFGGPVVSRARKHAHEGGVPEPATPTLARRRDGPFVGRQEELARLRETRAALVVGPPGIGKSRLAHEIGRETRLAVGRCSAYGTEMLAPLRHVTVELGAPDALDDAYATEVPLIFRQLCEQAAPVLVVFDDVHWANSLVIEAIEHLVAQGSEDVRVLCLAREEILEEKPAFLAGVERIALPPLSDGDARSLAGQLGAPNDSIVERAEGNPLFIEQLLAHATEEPAALPTSLQSLLAARLDRLAPAERATIDRAAIIGREFDATLVTELLGARSAREPLASLVRRGLLDPASPSEAFEERFRFRHSLIHEIAYITTPKQERARLHEAAADLLDERGASDEIVGFHLEQAAALRPDRDRHTARLAEDAGRRLGGAGITAWKRGDAGSATRLLRRAVDLLPERDAQRLELLCELGVALNTIGEPIQADDVLRQAAELGDRRIEMRARLEQALVASLADSPDSARLVDLAETSRPVFEAVGDNRALGRAWMVTGWVRGGAQGRHAEWEDAAQQALTHYDLAGWPISTCIGHIAAALYLGPTPVPDAIARCVRLLEDRVDDLGGEASVSAHLGGLHSMAGDFDEAARLLEHARHIYTELGRTPSLLRTCAPIEARAAWLRNDLESAAEIFARSCEQLLAVHGGFHLATQAAELAEVLYELGRIDDANAWCEIAERHARGDDRGGQVSVRIPRARLLALSGATDEAERLARESVALADQTDELNLRAAARLALADVLESANRAPDADIEIAAAAASYAAKSNAAATARINRRRVAAAPSHTGP